MANKNEPLFLKRFLDNYPVSGWPESLHAGRVLNVGSKEYGHGISYRDMFADKEILGIDLESGDGVDRVCNMQEDFSELEGERFAVVLCCSVLEHTAKPWVVAHNIERHLLQFGLLYITVPWVWRTHAYPKDYWRMSPDAIRTLFPNVVFKRIAHSTQMGNEFIKEGLDHDDKPPWRVVLRGRAHIAVQMVHMIGRMS